MAKKQRKNKELARLRREVEVLRAQLVTQEPGTSKTVKPNTTGPKAAKALGHDRERKRQLTTSQRVDPKFLKADLVKSVILTFITLGILVVLKQFL